MIVRANSHAQAEEEMSRTLDALVEMSGSQLVHRFNRSEHRGSQRRTIYQRLTRRSPESSDRVSALAGAGPRYLSRHQLGRECCTVTRTELSVSKVPQILRIFKQINAAEQLASYARIGFRGPLINFVH